MRILWMLRIVLWRIKGKFVYVTPVIKLRARRREKSYELIPFIRLLDFVSPELKMLSIQREFLLVLSRHGVKGGTGH